MILSHLDRIGLLKKAVFFIVQDRITHQLHGFLLLVHRMSAPFELLTTVADRSLSPFANQSGPKRERPALAHQQRILGWVLVATQCKVLGVLAAPLEPLA